MVSNNSLDVLGSAALTLALAPLAHKESKQKVRALRCSKPETNRRGFSLRKRPS